MNIINFSSINLWCTKNLVDTEFVIWQLLEQKNSNYQFEFYLDPEDEEVEYIVINTCGFISTGREEAEEAIKYYDNLWKKIVILWCYLEVADKNFLKQIKNLKAIIPFSESPKSREIIEENIKKIKDIKLTNFLDKIWQNTNKKAHIFWSKDLRWYLYTQLSYEYLKISEWCNNNCSFCIIPNIRWRQNSRPIEDILKEATTMISMWIKEIQIVAQDTTRYWLDIYNNLALYELLEKLDNLEWDFKYRLFYMYPDLLSLKHLEKLKNLKKLIPYFDFPFQHISPAILKNMWRYYKEEHIHNLLDYISKNFENPFIHTNFIIWFPWETEDDFEKLLDFIKKYEFDSVSVFGYHDEPLAPSYKLEWKIEDKIIQKRVKKLSEILDEIYQKKDKKRKNTKQIGYIEEITKDYISVRPEIKAPEVDKLDKISSKNIIEWNIELWEKISYIYK